MGAGGSSHPPAFRTGVGGIWDGLGDIVTLPVVLAPWWMGNGAIYPLSLPAGAGPTALFASVGPSEVAASVKPQQGGPRDAGWPCCAMLCYATRPAEAAGAGGLPPPSFPQAPSRRSFPDDLTGCTFLNCLVDCFIIGGQLKRRRVPVTPL